MEPDFYDLYKDLPIPELVKVARSPWDYLPEAVTIAQQILVERGVSAEEIGAEEWKLAQKEMLDAATKKHFGDYFEWVGELLQLDRFKGPTERWFAVLVLVYGIYYVYNLYDSVQLVVFYNRCEECREMKPTVLWSEGFFFYSTFSLYLILKQKPLGWSLLCIQAIAVNCIKLSNCFHYYMHHIYAILLTTYTIPLVVNGILLLFLFRPPILELFRIDWKIRDRTLLVALGLGLLGGVFL
jgi:hypothetical protein